MRLWNLEPYSSFEDFFLFHVSCTVFACPQFQAAQILHQLIPDGTPILVYVLITELKMKSTPTPFGNAWSTTVLNKIKWHS
jgi:hypothetical protein